MLNFNQSKPHENQRRHRPSVSQPVAKRCGLALQGLDLTAGEILAFFSRAGNAPLFVSISSAQFRAVQAPEVRCIRGRDFPVRPIRR